MPRRSQMSSSVVPEASGPPARSLLSVMLHDNRRTTTTRAKTPKRIALAQIFNILRRLAVIAAAIRYIQISLSASWYAWKVLNGTPNPSETLKVFTSSLIGDYVGDGLIDDSPLVQNVLGGDTTPRNYAVFLESANKTSFENCSDVPHFNPSIYNFEFLHLAYNEMVGDTMYNYTALDELELVVMVVDCSFTGVVTGDYSTVRAFNVNYEIPLQNKLGPGVLARLTVMKDMSGGILRQYYMIAETYPYQRSMEFTAYNRVGITAESFAEFRSIPQDPSTQPVKTLLTARERGFYNGQEQLNVRQMHTQVYSNQAKRMLERWEWVGKSTILDTYAWVHGVHLIFAVETTFSLVILAFVTYQKFRTGKVWIGDPFSSVSTASLVLRGVLVVFSMYVDSFWMINEYCVSFAASVTGTQNVRIHQELLHADIMVVYLAVVGLMSSLFRERIDPSVAIFLFELIHAHRLAIVKSVPVILDEIVTYSDAQYYLGVVRGTPVIAAMSPMRFWTAYQLPPRDFKFLISSFFPKAILLAIIAGFAIIHKIYRHYYPDPTRQRSSLSPERSTNDKTAMTMRGIVTHFEISTGAELQTRFGLISDYNNYVYFKGMKFASADGVYCSGYVVANGKFLVSSKDLLTIIVMKLVGARFANVYVYEVDGNNVKDSARLVYPKTFMWSDLWRLNVTVLL